MVYAQSIEESKVMRMARSLKRNGARDQEKTMFKNKVQSQGVSRSAKFKVNKRRGSMDGKPTCANCGKKHYGDFLLGTTSCFGCVKDGNKVRDCPMIASKGKEVSKLLLVFQKMMLRLRCISMHSVLGRKIWMRRRVIMMLVCFLVKI